MPFLELMKKQLTPQKLFFHFLFWTFHWYVSPKPQLHPP